MFGLRDEDIESIVVVLKKEQAIEQGVIFGSRVKGNYNNGSDVDIALKGAAVTDEIASHVSYALNEETLMPYKFDVLNFNTIDNADLLDQIRQEGKNIYQRSLINRNA